MSGWFVTANDIKQWTETNKRQSEEILPLLVRKLILASVKPKEISFPAGDSVTTGGWDGIVEVQEGNEFVPTGKSGWEFSTETTINGKADEDFNKRTGKPDPLTSQESTFIFVTTRHWANKDRWEKEKRDLGKWKDVRGINAGSLEAWLQSCPAIHRWFSGLIGKRTSALWDIEQGWNSFSNMTDVALTKEFFLKSREEDTKKLINGLTGKGSILRIKAQSVHEAWGFILSSLISREESCSRILIVKNQAAWDWLIDFKNTLILIPYAFKPDNIGNAIKNGHNVVIASDIQNTGAFDIILNRLSRNDRIAAIQSVGLSKDQAERVYTETKGYFEPILRNPLLKPIDRPDPQWAKAANPNVLFAALFATEWDSSNIKDKEIMSTLAGMSYKEFENSIIDLSKTPDPPIRPVGKIWQVISKVDMWLLIAPRLNQILLERLGTMVNLVLSDMDPAFYLPATERFMANIKGLKPLYSRHIKSGLANTLALLSTFGDTFADQCKIEKPSILARYWVSLLFKDNVEAKLWYSLGSGLQFLSEAAPEEFLEALDRSVSGDHPPIMGLFQTEDNGIFGGCPHANLLWAIELLAWNLGYFARAVSCLARLSEIDPGGNNGNRPFSSLVEIFLGWVNNTQTTHKERLQIIEKVLLPNYPEITWKLMISLLIQHMQISSGVNKPAYQEWSENDKQVSDKEYYEYIEAIVDILIREVEHGLGSRLSDLLNHFDSYTGDQQKVIITRLTEINPETLQRDSRVKFIYVLRQLISQHRRYPDDKSILPNKLIDELYTIYQKFEFEDVVDKYIYLFDSGRPYLIEPPVTGKMDFRKEEQLIQEMRLKAIEEILFLKGFEEIKSLAQKCKNPEMVGQTIELSSFSEKAVPYIEVWLGSEKYLNLVAQRYISIRSYKNWDWAESLFVKNTDWNDDKKVAFLLCLPVGSKTFHLIENQELSIQRGYWSAINGYYLSTEERDKTGYVANKMLEYNRPLAAIEVVSQLLWGNIENKEINSELLANILMKIAMDPSDINRVSQNVRYDIQKAIGFIQDRAELPAAKIIQIEWMYFKTIHRSETKPRYLNEAVANDPSFFVQLVTWVFQRKDGISDPEDDLSKDLLKQRAETSRELLDTLSILPGSTGNGIDTEKLNQWVDQSRVLLEKVGRLNVGDHQIGHYLARCPEGTDGIWPHEEVRNVVERIKSSDFEAGIALSKVNSKGATWRSPYDGGGQERDLEKRYVNDAKKLSLLYPRTASILRNLASDFGWQAQHNDKEVELRE